MGTRVAPSRRNADWEPVFGRGSAFGRDAVTSLRKRGPLQGACRATAASGEADLRTEALGHGSLSDACEGRSIGA
jgi:hypothetical protein